MKNEFEDIIKELGITKEEIKKSKLPIPMDISLEDYEKKITEGRILLRVCTDKSKLIDFILESLEFSHDLVLSKIYTKKRARELKDLNKKILKKINYE